MRDSRALNTRVKVQDVVFFGEPSASRHTKWTDHKENVREVAHSNPIKLLGVVKIKWMGCQTLR